MLSQNRLSQYRTDDELKNYCLQLAQAARSASRCLAQVPTNVKNRWLLDSAEALIDASATILQANQSDLSQAEQLGLTQAAMERLTLSPARIEAMAVSLREIAGLRDPVGETIEGWVTPNGLEIRKVRVPIGTVLFIYESRPNVTVDAAALCVKSGNAVILRGGKEAIQSSMALAAILNEVGERHGIPPGSIQLVNTTDRKVVGQLLGMNEMIDVVIPRGGKSLIERVVQEARMPVIKHYDGNCHIFVDSSADASMAEQIVVNSKCQRMGVCNACESLLIHQDVAETILPRIAEALGQNGIELRGDAGVCQLIPGARPGTQEDWAAEYLGPVISVCIVNNLEAAIEHINRYGSHHTDAIITRDLESARKFQLGVDSGVVLVNASTRFNDGGQFGFGAEIGISTDKLHARGPCGLRELTTHKYLVMGDGQLRT
jgi:glutamate-5-semialdehyde dehydrogenase